MNPQALTASQKIAHFAVAFRVDDMSEAQYDMCVRSFVDTFAGAIAGRNEPATQSTLRYLKAAGVHRAAEVNARPNARLWGQATVADCESAALFNGITGHVLDYDDVTPVMRGHPSVVLWPGLIALAETRDICGARLAAAFVLGVEVICKIARPGAGKSYTAGWHTTASIGIVGATVACAYLLELSAPEIVSAIGLATAQSGGVRENVGTEAKSFQAGQAAASAVRAVLLAEAGFQSSPTALDGLHGYNSLYAHGEDLTAELASLGRQPLEIERSGLDIKQYPMCYATHRALDALLGMRREHGLTLAEIESVRIRTSKGALTPLVVYRPTTGLEGKFSMEYAIAAALSDGAIRLATFTDESVRRETLQNFIEHVDVKEIDGDGQQLWAEVELKCKDGRAYISRVETLRGSSQNPLSDAAFIEKITDCLTFSESLLSAKRLFEAAREMRTRKTRDFLALLDCESAAGFGL